MYDVHRSDAPPKLNVIHLDQINRWVEEEALTAPAIVLARITEWLFVDRLAFGFSDSRYATSYMK